MSILNTVMSVLFFLFTAPIFIYLTYQILMRVEATELMWFLFWIYIPLTILIAILRMVVERSEKK